MAHQNLNQHFKLLEYGFIKDYNQLHLATMVAFLTTLSGMNMSNLVTFLNTDESIDRFIALFSFIISILVMGIGTVKALSIGVEKLKFDYIKPEKRREQSSFVPRPALEPDAARFAEREEEFLNVVRRYNWCWGSRMNDQTLIVRHPCKTHWFMFSDSCCQIPYVGAFFKIICCDCGTCDCSGLCSCAVCQRFNGCDRRQIRKMHHLNYGNLNAHPIDEVLSPNNNDFRIQIEQLLSDFDRNANASINV